MSTFAGEKRYEGVRFNVISVRGVGVTGWGPTSMKKALHNT